MKRFPFGLTIAALTVFVLLVGLGLWQLRRLEETNLNRSRIAALVRAPSEPLESLLARARPGDRLDHTRVSLRCESSEVPAPIIYRYSVVDGAVGWRLLAMCRLAAAGYDGIAIDRGHVAALDGAMSPPALSFREPQALTGVLRSLGGMTSFGDTMQSVVAGVRLVRVVDAHAIDAMARPSGLKAPAPYYVVVESETPALEGVTPAPVAEDVPRDNFEYALTWFGLAGALGCVYAALVWRRLRGR